MDPNPQCSALAKAKDRTGLSYAEIGRRIGKSEQHVTDICTGAAHPSQSEFTALANVLGITTPLPDSHAR